MSHGWKKLFWWDTSIENKWEDKIHYEYVDFNNFSTYDLPANLKEIVSISWTFKQSWKAEWQNFSFTWVSNSWITYNTWLVNTVLYWPIVKWTCTIRYTINNDNETSSKYIIPAIVWVLILVWVWSSIKTEISPTKLASGILQTYENFINKGLK